MFISRRRRLSGSAVASNPFATSVTVPRVGPYSETFTVGRTSTNSLTLAPATATSGAIPANTGVPGVGIHKGNSEISGSSLMIGRVGGVGVNNITITDYDFRGINYNINIYGQNVTFVQCLFDLSGWARNQDCMTVNNGNNAYANFENCHFDGFNTPWQVQQYIEGGKIGYIRYCDFQRIPGDWLFFSGGSSAYVGEVDVSYNRVHVTSSIADGASLLVGTETRTAGQSISITDGFTVTTNATGGATATITAGSKTVQQIMDTINAAGGGMAASINSDGYLQVFATAYGTVGPPSSSVTRTITLANSGGASDYQAAFGAGVTTPVSNNAISDPLTYYGAHADVLQIPIGGNTNSMRFHHNLLDMTPVDSTNRAQGTSPINVSADLGDHYGDFILEKNTIVLSSDGTAKNCGYAFNEGANAPSGRRYRALHRIANNEIQTGLTGYVKPIESHRHTGSVKAGWATPGTFNSTGLTNGDTITFSDGTNTVTVTVASNQINGQQVLDAINNASPFWLTASVSSNALRIEGRALDASETRSNFLVIGSTGTGSTALTDFGLTAGTKTASANGNLINPFSFEGNFDYDAGVGTPVTAAWNANSASATINPLLAAPASPSVTGQTTTTLTVSFTEVSGARDYQYSIDGGSNWSALTTSGSGTLSGTISGLTPDTAYTQIQVRARNTYSDLGVLVQPGTATANFSGTTEAEGGAFFMAGFETFYMTGLSDG